MSNKESVVEITKLLRKEQAGIIADWANMASNTAAFTNIDQAMLIQEAEPLLLNFIQGIESDDFRDSTIIANTLSQETAGKGIKFSQLVRVMLILRDAMARMILNKLSSDIEKLTSTLKVFEASANTFLTSLVNGFIEGRDEIIRIMSTPIFQLQDEILLIPLIGTLDSDRAERLTEQLLESIHSHRAYVCVLDITGVPLVDTGVANHLLQTVQAARLMGATVLISGISSQVAMTLVSLGVNMEHITTCSNLQSAIKQAEALVRDRMYFSKKE